MTDMSVTQAALKHCNKCNVNKPLDQFYVRRKAKDGLSHFCISCMKTYNVRHYAPLNDPSIMKTCSLCGNALPSTTEYFHKSKLFRDGLIKRCKQCISTLEKPHHLPKNQGVKACSACGINKPATTANFYACSGNSDGLLSRCIECESKRAAQWRGEHKDYLSMKAHQNYQENRERYKQSNKRWLAEHPERAKEIAKARTSRYLARKKNLPSTFSAEDLRTAITHFNGCCAVCGNQLNNLLGDTKAHMDHWIPLSNPNCPGTVPTNMIPLCGGVNGCNQSKQDAEPEEWLKKKFGKRKAKLILNRIEEYFRSIANGGSS